MEFFLKKQKNAKKDKNLFFLPFSHYHLTLRSVRKNISKNFPNQFYTRISKFEPIFKNSDSDGDVTDENFAVKLKEGRVNMYTKGIGNLKRVVMSKICSQKHPLAGGTQNICKSGTSKKALF